MYEGKKSRRKMQKTKRMGCTAEIRIRGVMAFPEYKASKHKLMK